MIDGQLHLGILELHQVCVEMRDRNQRLFELLGDWVGSTANPEPQQWFAEACHRHAWHAELWARRLPLIPDVAEPPEARPIEEPRDRVGWYGGVLVDLERTLAELAGRADRRLDPSTARTVALVAADVADLARRAPG